MVPWRCNTRGCLESQTDRVPSFEQAPEYVEGVCVAPTPGDRKGAYLMARARSVDAAGTEYKWHPAASLFPLLSGDEFKDLAADILDRGLLNPIVMHGGEVLDGRNRLIACIAAGVEPRFVEWVDPGCGP